MSILGWIVFGVAVWCGLCAAAGYAVGVLA